VRSPEYVKELVTHHVGGYLKIAPEHTEAGPLSKMMKPGIGSYDRFKQLFDQYSAEAGKKQYLIPYFIAAHPGTSDEDMMNLALWLKRNGFRADQVQTFYPSPMATATAMYHTGRNPLKGLSRDAAKRDLVEKVDVVRGEKRRRLHKAFLRYHDAAGWPLLRDALMANLIGNGNWPLLREALPKAMGARRPDRQRQAPPDEAAAAVQRNGAGVGAFHPNNRARSALSSGWPVRNVGVWVMLASSSAACILMDRPQSTVMSATPICSEEPACRCCTQPRPAMGCGDPGEALCRTAAT
jgi:hypothetical protein